MGWRKCPSCGNLTTSFSCTRCTGMPMTRDLDKEQAEENERNRVYPGCDPCGDNNYDGAVTLPEPPRVGPPPLSSNNCKNCGKALNAVQICKGTHGTTDDPCRYTKPPHISSLYGRRDHLLRGWLRGFICWWRAGGFTRMSYNWCAGHQWVETGRENHYDSSVTVEFTCQYCGRIGHGQGR